MTIFAQAGRELPINQEEILREIAKLSKLKTNERGEIINSGLRLHQLATQASSGHFGDHLVQSLDPEQIKKLQDFSLLFETTLDDTFMNEIMSGELSQPDQHPLQSIYNLLAQREHDLVLAHRQQISSYPWLHIGSGYPETAIGLQRQFGIPIICLDKNPDVVQKAELVLKKLNLWGEDKLTIVNANGQDIAPESNVVIVSAMVPNDDKERIIENMRRLAYGNQGEPLLILRTPANPAFTILYPTLFNESSIDDWWLRKVDDSLSQLTPKEWLRSMLFEVIETADVRRGFDRIPAETKAGLKPVR